MLGIGVRVKGRIMLVARIARRKKGIYYLIPRDYAAFGIVSDEHWDPHASYHVDGTRHFKSDNQVRGGRDQRQPLGESFAGVEDLTGQSFGPGDLLGEQTELRESEFDAVFELPMDLVPPSYGVHLRVALCAPEQVSVWHPQNAHEIARYWSRDATPWIEVTVWRIDYSDEPAGRVVSASA